MAKNDCPVCGANPCYGICPTQDPFHGDQAAENADYEFNARYDDERERYAATAADADSFADDSNDDHCCDCGVSLPDPDKRHLINGGALCECCYIEREAKADAQHFPWQRAVGYAPVNDDDIPF